MEEFSKYLTRSFQNYIIRIHLSLIQDSDQHALQSSQKEENPFKRMAREYALQETIIYNYLVWLTIKYDKQFSDYKESKKRRSRNILYLTLSL